MNKRGQSFFKQKRKTTCVVSAKRWLLICSTFQRIQPWASTSTSGLSSIGRDSPSDARNTLLVVTTLIVAVTFQAAINPPGGVWQDDKYSPANCTVVTSDNNCTIIRHAGTSVLYYRKKTGYELFLAVNTLAFSASTNTILYLLLDSPFQTEVMLCIGSTNFAFGAAVAAVHPPKPFKWGLNLVAGFLPYILRLFSNFINRYK